MTVTGTAPSGTKRRRDRATKVRPGGRPGDDGRGCSGSGWAARPAGAPVRPSARRMRSSTEAMSRAFRGGELGKGGIGLSHRLEVGQAEARRRQSSGLDHRHVLVAAHDVLAMPRRKGTLAPGPLFDGCQTFLPELGGALAASLSLSGRIRVGAARPAPREECHPRSTRYLPRSILNKTQPSVAARIGASLGIRRAMPCVTLQCARP